MKMIVLAAGQGTRLRPITENIPKCMVNLAEKPIIEWQIENALSMNFKKILVIGGYQAEKISTLGQELLINEKIKYVIQINGKKRGLINANHSILEEDLIKLVKNDENINKYLDNKNIKKKIFVPNKLINIIV